MARTPARPRNGNGHANGHANGALLSVTADPGQIAPPSVASKRAIKISPEMAYWAKRRGEGKGKGADRIVPPRHPKPFELAHNAFPPVVLEALKLANTPTMAQDEALAETATWANEAAGSFAEGTAFLGYAFLATLAQRPEFRVASEEIAGEMTREWIEIRSKGRTSDKAEKIKAIQDDMESFKLQEVFRDAAECDGLMGRGHIFIDFGVDDREELKTTIGNGADQISKLRVAQGTLKGFKSIEATWCYPNNYNSSDPLADDWYNPRSWVVMSKEVHSTRFLTIIGRKVPDMLKPAYAFGGLSLSQMLMPYVDNWLRTRQSVADLLEAFSLMVLSTAMDADMGEGNADLFERVDFFNNTRNNRGMLVVDKETEEVSNVAAPLGTLDALQAQSQEHMASISRIPIVKLLGIQPAGLNASSEGEIRSFYDWIHSFQEKLFREPLTTCINFIQLNRFGEVDPDLTFVFKDLWQIDDAQEATVQQTWAATHEAYLGMGVVQPEDIRKTLTADPDSPYAGIELEEMPAPPQPDLSSLGIGGAGGAPGAGQPQPGGGPAPQAPPQPPPHSFKQPTAPPGSSGQGASVAAKPSPANTNAGGVSVSHVNPGRDAMIRAGALDAEGFDWASFDASWEEDKHKRGQPKNKGQFAKGGGQGGAPPKSPPQTPAAGAGGGGTSAPTRVAPATQTGAPAAPAAVSTSSGLTPEVRQQVWAAAKRSWGILDKNEAEGIAHTLSTAMGYDKSHITIREDEPHTFVLNGETMESGGEANRNTGEINLWPSGFMANQFPGAVAHEVMHQKFETALRAYRDADPTAKLRMGAFLDAPEARRHLIDSDGVTEYSRQYWAATANGEMSATTAVHETLAEMARLDVQGGLTNNPNVDPAWAGLYNAVNDIHPAIKNQYGPRASAAVTSDPLNLGLSNTRPPGYVPESSQHHASASDLLKQTYPIEMSQETFLLGEPPALRSAMAEAEANLRAHVATDKDVAEGGLKVDGKWTPEREALHEQIIAKILTPEIVAAATPAPGQKPIFTLLGGRGGSGKSWFTDPAKGGPVDQQHALLLNNDDIKEMIPEYQGWNAAHVHEEASDIFDEIDRKARALGISIIHDATLKTYKSAKSKVDAYRSAGYAVDGHYMHVTPPIAAHRSMQRFMSGRAKNGKGRYVPPSYILSSTSNESSFDALIPDLDNWSLYSNLEQGVAPKLISQKRKAGE